MIEKISDTEYMLVSRGAEMTLIRADGQWEMYVVNASVRAWRNGVAIPKFFSTLEDVETRYKSWRGIAELVNLDESNQA